MCFLNDTFLNLKGNFSFLSAFEHLLEEKIIQQFFSDLPLPANISVLGWLAAGRLVCDGHVPWLEVNECCWHFLFYLSCLGAISHGSL